MPRARDLTKLERAILQSVAGQAGYASSVATRLGRPRKGVTTAMRRLESMGLVRGKWDTFLRRPGPSRRIYNLTAEGRREHGNISD